MKPKFLLDEHLDPEIKKAVQGYDPGIEIAGIGDDNVPPLSTPDPDILVFCEQNQYVLVTDNRATMAGHVRDHYAEGRHHWGVFRLRRRVGIGRLAEELYLFWAASEAEEWIDRMEWIPY